MRYASNARGPHTHCAWAFLAAALAACSADRPTAPVVRDRDARATTVEASAEQARVVAWPLSNRFAYVWADQPSAASYTPNPSFAYNATGGSIQITRHGNGRYEVAFNSPAGWTGTRLGFAVTAYGSSTLGCSLDWHSPSAQLVVRVNCYDRVTHLPADSRFTLLVVGSGSLQTRSAFAFANEPSSPSYTPNPLASYTTGPGAMLITHLALDGDYRVDLGTGNPAHSTFLVGEKYFYPGHLCTIRAWLTSSVGVRCFDDTGALHDKHYWILQVQGGRPGRRIGFAWANQPTAASYTPALNRSFNSSGGGIMVTRTGVGRYAIEFAGLQKLAGHTENVQVTPWGTGYSSCKVVGWGNSAAGLRVSAECRKLNGTFKDARFNVLVIE